MSTLITRRNFLKRTTRAATAAVGFPYVISSAVLGRSGTVAPSNRITMGFIGMGGQGIGNMTGNDYSNIPGGFMGKPEVQAVAVCDVDIKRRIKARDMVNVKYGKKGCAAYNDFRELLARKDLDAVMIATPDHWHALIGIAAAKAGKDVYSEKPLAHNIIEGRAICNVVKKYGTVWQTGTQQRSWREFRVAAEMVQNGRIGEVKMVRVGLPAGDTVNRKIELVPVPNGFDYDMWLGPAPWVPYCDGRCHGNFRRNSDYSSGPIADWAGHHVDIAQWGMGTDFSWPVEIEGEGEFLKNGLYDNMTTFHIECKFAEGFTMIIEDSNRRAIGKDGKEFTKGLSGVNMGILFEGSEGWIQVNRSALDVYPDSTLKKPVGPDEIHLYRSNDHKQNFLDCIRSRAQTVAPADVAHHSIAIGYMGIISMRLGRKLRWDKDKEQFIDDEEANRMLYRDMRSPWHL
jgi:predicted dehydrogenase